MKNHNTILDIVLIAFFLVISAVVSIPLTHFLENRSISIADRYINSIEEILGSDITFKLKDKDLLRHVKLYDVVIQDKSVSRNIIANIDELTIEYDLLKLLFMRDLDQYTINLTANSMTGNLNESEIKRIISQNNKQPVKSDYISQLLPKLLIKINIQNSNFDLQYRNIVTEIENLDFNLEIEKQQFTIGNILADLIKTELYDSNNSLNLVGTLSLENIVIKTVENESLLDFIANISKTTMQLNDSNRSSSSVFNTIVIDGGISLQDLSLHHFNLNILNSVSENKNDAYHLLIESNVLDVIAQQKSYSTELEFQITSEQLVTEARNINSDSLSADMINAKFTFNSNLSIPTEIPALNVSFDELALLVESTGDFLAPKDEKSIFKVDLQKSDIEFFKNPTRSTYNILLKTDAISSNLLIPGVSLSGIGKIKSPTILLETKLDQFIDISFLSESSTFDMLYKDTKFTIQANSPNLYIKNSGHDLSGTVRTVINSSLQLSNPVEISSVIDLKADYNYDNKVIHSDLQLNSIFIDQIEFFKEVIGSMYIDFPTKLVSGNLQIPGLATDFEYNIVEEALSSELQIDNLSVDIYEEQLSRFIDYNNLSFLAGSQLNGNVSVDLLVPNYSLSYAGRLVLNNLFINSDLPKVNIETSLEGDSSSISIIGAEITIPDYLMVLDGTLDIKNRTPDLQINIFKNNSESNNFLGGASDLRPLISAGISGSSLLDGEIEFYYKDLPEVSIKSHYSVSSDFNTLDLDGVVDYRNITYPIILSADIDNLFLTGIGGNQKSGFAEFSLYRINDGSMNYSGSLVLDNQHLPDNRFTFLSLLSIDADINFEFNNLQDWMISINSADIKNIEFGRNPVTLNLESVQIVPELITIRQLIYNDSVSSLSGEGEISYELSPDLLIESLISIKNDNEQINISLDKSGKGIYLSADISGGRLLHAPIEIGSGIVDGTLTFSGNESEYILFSNLSIRNGLMSQKPYSGSVLLSGNERELKIDNFSGKYDGNSVEDFALNYNFLSGIIESTSFQQLNTKNGIITFNLDLKAEVQKIISIFDISVNRILNQDLVIESTISEISYNEISLLHDFTAAAKIANGLVSISGGPQNSMFAEIARDGKLTASIGQTAESSLPFSFSLNGFLNNGQIDVKTEDVQFDLTFLNSIFRMSEYLHFDSGTIYGNMQVTGSLEDPDFFGELFCDYTEITSIVLPKKAKAENISASISEKTLYFVPFYAEVDNKFSKIKMQMGLEYLIPFYYDISIIIPENEKIYFKNNFNKIGLIFDGMISGLVNFEGDGFEIKISGDLKIDDTIISLSPDGKFDNLNSRAVISAELEMTTGNNVKAILPNLDFPIISATLAENQNLSISYNANNKNYQVSGDMKILGGEIFYFQRSFFITDGLLKMNENHLYKFDPNISLEAKLRDFDKNGEKIDIFLKIQNDPISSFTPVLSSRPSKSVAEIAEILGQNILPGNIIGGTNINSALALATIATDVIQKLGIIKLDPISDFENIVRNTFQLDLFSIRTQVFQNIILETITNSQLQMLSLNPIARYLDNTTVFLGKYINNDIFLQAMLHLTANDSYGSGFFMTDDLELDIELSIEWENPLYFLRVSTQPDGLQPFQLLDALTIGVSWSFSF